MSTLESLVRRYYDAFNARDFEAYATLFHRDVTLEAPGVSEEGVTAMRGFDRAWTEVCPAARLEILRLVVADGWVAVGIWFDGGPQRGALTTPAGTIAPTGKSVSVPGCAMFRVENDRIVSQKLLFEPSLVPLQLGAPA